jgi:hypothetical protein
MKPQIILHGEVAFYEIDKIPDDADGIVVNDNYYVVGESETHGNDHRVDVFDTKLFTKDDILFLESIGTTKVYCPNKSRHDTITLPKGNWKIGHAQEYDYFTESLNRVRD